MSDDWNPPEAFLEHGLYNNPEAILQHTHRSGKLRVYRQFTIAGAGIADLVIITDNRISVVEIKRHTIDEGAVAQCLRYMGALHMGLLQSRPEDKYFPLIQGILCAPSISQGAEYAMYAAGMEMFYYRCTPTVVARFANLDVENFAAPSKDSAKQLLSDNPDLIKPVEPEDLPSIPGFAETLTDGNT